MNFFFNIETLLKTAANKYAERVAIEGPDEKKITYRELTVAATQIQTTLQKKSIGFGNRVGILAPKSIEYITFIFGILKSGAAYVPLDNKTPIERNRLICEDGALQAIFIEKNLVPDFTKSLKLHHSFEEISISNLFSLIIFKEKKELHNEQLAYILYTSGSTGIPKGVKHTHYSAYTFIKWCSTNFSPGIKDRFISIAPFHFDLSVFDLFVSLKVGATLVLTDEKTALNPRLLSETIAKKQISILYATPSALSYLSAYGKMDKYNYNFLHTILFAGEVFPINNLKKLKEIFPKTKMFNLYGPTETNVCTWFKIPDTIPNDRNEPFPIGKPCSYASYAIIKDDKTSSEGELWIGGDSVMNGYWNDQEKTNSSFEIDINGELWYRTGDRVSLTEENNLIYKHRKDRMVKRNGYRIELDEIEMNLLKNKNIFEVAVTANSINSQTETRITAHIVWSPEKNQTSLDLMNYCNNILPGYMIPDNFKFYEYLPKTSTHKINYKHLALNQ